MMLMNKKASMAAILSVLVTATLLVGLGKADPFMPLPGPQITFSSPENNKIYCVNNVSLTFTLSLSSQAAYSAGQYANAKGLKSISYRVDHQGSGQFADSNELSKTFSVTLQGLSEGPHTVEVYATAVWDVNIIQNIPPGSFKEISFEVDTVTPKIQILSKLDMKFAPNNVHFNFTISELVRWIGYSIDLQDNVTISESASPPSYYYGRYNYAMALVGLAEGSHILKLYAMDGAGNTGESEPLQFSVTLQVPSSSTPIETATPTPSPTEQPTTEPTLEPTVSPSPITDNVLVADFTPAILVGIATIAVAVGALVIFKRRR